MADEEHLAILIQGPEIWNAWRREHGHIRPNFRNADLRIATLRGADLRSSDLIGANLSGVDLAWATATGSHLIGSNLGGAHMIGAKLSRAQLIGASLRQANLRQADLTEANLREAKLPGAILRDANFQKANLRGADLGGADLTGVDLTDAFLNETYLSNVNLSTCIGLDRCQHAGHSIVDHRTLMSSGQLPLGFLRGVGLPDNLIDYLPSLFNEPIQFYSCFISYSSRDQAFAERLHADLQAKGVRCWFAPHDMPIGAKILDAIDEAIRLRDKVLLVLSEGAIDSDWVEGEVTRALEEERERKRTLLFPIRIDDAVLDTNEAWARMLRGQRHIGDFTRWKEHDAYQKGLERLLRDLRVAAPEGTAGTAS